MEQNVDPQGSASGQANAMFLTTNQPEFVVLSTVCVQYDISSANFAPKSDTKSGNLRRTISVIVLPRWRTEDAVLIYRDCKHCAAI
jgi:hypothetical protein